MTQQDSSPSNLRYPAWQREYEASLREPDPKKRRERAHTVEAAIFNCLQELAQTTGSTDHKAEEHAIAEALRTLRGFETGQVAVSGLGDEVIRRRSGRASPEPL
jgi:hypothetical protein